MADVFTWQDGNLWGVMDDTLRVRIGRSEAGYLWIGVDIRMWADRPTMGNFTHDDSNQYQPNDLTLTDDGLLTALHRHEAQADFRTGFTLRVPLAFVGPLRKAIKAASEG